MLVGLGAEAGDATEVPRTGLLPACTHGVGAVFDQEQTEFLADVHDGIHVADVPAHVREHEEARLALLRLGAEVVQIDVEGLVDLDQYGNAAGIVDRARDRGECVGVGQDGFAFLQPGRAQCDVQGIAARGTGEAVVTALIGCEFALQGRRFGFLAGIRIVAMQFSRLQDLDGARDALFGNGFLLREGLGEPLHQINLSISQSLIHSAVGRRRRTPSSLPESISADASHRRARVPPFPRSAKCGSPPR